MRWIVTVTVGKGKNQADSGVPKSQSRGRCPKFQLLEYNYFISAGQRAALLCFKRSTFNNSTIWDIALLAASMWAKVSPRRGSGA